MSYEHCERHDEDATNGCAKCEAEQVDMLSTAAAIHFSRMPPEDIRDKLRKADSSFLDRLVMYLISVLLLAGCHPSQNEIKLMYLNSSEFERNAKIENLSCNLSPAGFGTVEILYCSGKMEGKPVKYSCSTGGCSWLWGDCQ